MATTIKEMVYSQVSPEEVFESFYGLNHRERNAYEMLLGESEARSVEDIAEAMDCSLSTAYRYVDTLEERGLVRQTGIFDGEYLKSGYVAEDPTVIADLMSEFVDSKYEQCKENIESIGSTEDVRERAEGVPERSEEESEAAERAVLTH